MSYRKARGYLDDCGWEFDPGEVRRREDEVVPLKGAHEVWHRDVQLGLGTAVRMRDKSRNYPDGQSTVTVPFSTRHHELPLDYVPPPTKEERMADALRFWCIVGVISAFYALAGRAP